MVLSNLTQNLRGAWMISPEAASVSLPLLRGVLQGQIEEIKESSEPYRVMCSDYRIGKTREVNSQTEEAIYVTYLKGTMLKHNSCGDPGTRKIGQELLRADQDPSIIGHIIIADSGGGNANSVPELTDAITQLTKPIVAWVDGMAASACIYAISYTDKIIAHQPMDRIGCIGTMIELSGYSQFYKSKDGYIKARIYADSSTEKNADYEAALEGNAQIIKENLLNPLSEQFINDMKANRPSVTDDQLTGKTYFAKDVVGTLIDSIGTFDDAVNAVITLHDAANPNKQTMEQNNLYPNLTAIPTLTGLVCDEDGSAHLQECQLTDIEAALAAGANATELQTTIDNLNQQISERDATIAQRDARITELENSLQAALARQDEEQPAEVEVTKDPAGVKNDDYKPAQTYEEALAACQEFLANN